MIQVKLAKAMHMRSHGRSSAARFRDGRDLGNTHDLTTASKALGVRLVQALSPALPLLRARRPILRRTPVVAAAVAAPAPARRPGIPAAFPRRLGSVKGRKKCATVGAAGRESTKPVWAPSDSE